MGALRIGNLGLAVLHAAQAAIVLAIGADLTIAITAQWADGPPGAAVLPPETLFDLSVRWAVAAFLLLAAVDHLAVALPGVTRWYARNLERGINDARWIEYSLSASLMVVVIATFAGVTDGRALLAVAGANAAMILFGLVMEHVNSGRDRVDWLPFWLGCVVGAMPWIVIAVSIAGSEASGTVPGFVYGIFVSLFVFFMSFAANQWLQFRRIGPWARPLVPEWTYLGLSLVAKSALAWQVYAGALAV
jgi:hypothetical protein